MVVERDANASDLSGPRATTSLLYRRRPLASPAAQLEALAGVRIDGSELDFEAAVGRSGHVGGLRPGELRVLQLNIGKRCNMTCRHCHVDAGPHRTEQMSWHTMELALQLIDRLQVPVVDLTGGAPELHPHFRRLVEACAARDVHVIDRCNLTILLLPRFRDLPAWLGERGVEVVCSLPHHSRRNTDAQRGDGTFERSIQAIRLLNEAGYGQGDPQRVLTLMSNPAGAYLAASQSGAEGRWREVLRRRHGLSFDRLIALNNMPISRFLEWLRERDLLDRYMARLVGAFNPAAVDGLMCRDTLSIGWDGRIYDCDFNQMLELEARDAKGALHVRDLDVERLWARRIRTNRHCFGCTAGAGSSCAGATAGSSG